MTSEISEAIYAVLRHEWQLERAASHQYCRAGLNRHPLQLNRGDRARSDSWHSVDWHGFRLLAYSTYDFELARGGKLSVNLAYPNCFTQFESAGFVRLAGLLSPGDVTQALNEAARFAAQARSLEQSTPEFNLESADGGFYGQDGTAPGFLGVLRKVNYLERISDFFNELAFRPEILSVASELLGGRPVALHNTILWCKPPRVGSAKPLHQDAPFFAPPLQDYVTIWTALDRAAEDNGCLEFVPGSHTEGILPFNGREKLVDEQQHGVGRVPCVLEPGDAVAFHACTLHSSKPNQSTRPRRAVMLRYRASQPTAALA